MEHRFGDCSFLGDQEVDTVRAHVTVEGFHDTRPNE